MTHKKMYECYRTPSGELRYRSRIRVHGKRVSKSFPTLADLKFWLGKMEKVRRDIRLGEQTFLPITFEEAARRWFVEYLDVQMSPSMRVNNRELFEVQFFPRVGSRDLKEITHAEWNGLLSELAKEREWGPSTFNRRRGLLMSFYNWCKEQDLTPENPMERIRRRPEPELEPRFMTAMQLQTFLEVCEQAPYAVCFFLLANTGMRISEALGLRWCDVDLNGGWIRIGRIYCQATKRIEERTKGGHARVIGLNAALRDVLLRERRRSFATGPQDLIVAMEKGESPGHGRIRNVFERNLRSGGFGHHGIHDLRHSFASVFMMSGGSLWDLKTILGHSTIDLTERYSHFSPNHLRRQAEQVSFGVRSEAEVLRFHKTEKPVVPSSPFLSHDDFKKVNG